MSSIHSQASDSLPQETQIAVQPQTQQQQYGRVKTPAIQEENEEDDSTTLDNTSGTSDNNNNNNNNNNNSKSSSRTDSTKSSSSSNAGSSNNNGGGGKSVATITFEKQRVIPPRARIHSAQSVLSTISLQPMHNHHSGQNQSQHHSQQQQENGEDQRNLSFTNLASINQQIQSPAMSSIRKRGVTNSVTSGRISDEDVEIGLRQPFTDDKRLYLDANSVKQRQQQRQNQVQRKDSLSLKTNGSTVVETDDVEEDDIVMQKRLTAQALRKLSHLRGSSTMGMGVDKVVVGDTNNNNNNNHDGNNSNNNNRSNDGNNNNNNSNNNNSISYGDGDGRTIDENNQDLETMTHLKFGNKKVFLDSFPQGNNAISTSTSTLTPQFCQQQQPLQSIRKASLEVIQQPGQQDIPQQQQPQQPKQQQQQQQRQQPHAGLPVSSNVTPGNLTARRSVRQIHNPKKPLYLPAVLRNVSETNLSNEDIVRPSSPPQSMVSNNRTITSRNLQPQNYQQQGTSASSAASVHSSSSSVIETCRRQIALWFFSNGEYNSVENRWSQLLDPPAPPTKSHWLPDSKRSSCNYCHKLFTFWERKHHCRHCGDIFCQQHLGHWLYLNTDASFIIGGGGLGTLSKICDGCLEEYENVVKNPKWKSQKLDSVNKQNGLLEPAASTATAIRNMEIGSQGGTNVQNNDSKEDVFGSIAGSVPADWNWSSF